MTAPFAFASVTLAVIFLSVLPVVRGPQWLGRPAVARATGLDTDADWLTALNHYRGLAGVKPVTEDPSLSVKAAAHARYVALTGQVVHREDPTNPLYTVEGDDAGRNSNIRASTERLTPRGDIEAWMRAPFHALALIDPTLRSVGFAAYNNPEDNITAHTSVLYVSRPPIRYVGGRRQTTASAIFPRNGAEIQLRTYEGNEVPDPLTSCPGYQSPAGLPIVANFGDDLPFVSARLTRDGAVLPTCAIDGLNYANDNGDTRAEGRRILAKHQVVLIPKDPLRAGTYDVEITAGLVTLRSTFRVAPSAPGALNGWKAYVAAETVSLAWNPPDDGGSDLDHYLVSIEPGGLQYQVSGTATGAELRGAVPAGPIAITVRAVNAVGPGRSVSMELTIPVEAASTTTAPTTTAAAAASTVTGAVPPRAAATPARRTTTTLAKARARTKSLVVTKKLSPAGKR